MKNKELYIKLVFWGLWVILVSICVFYIIYNAHWIIGDDAIIIRHTGSGRAFRPMDTVNPQTGRFFPFSYLAYNVLLLFNDGYISPRAHYMLHGVFFVVFSLSFTIMLLKSLENLNTVYKYILSFLTLVVFVGRVYPQYTECFSTSWCGYSIVALFVMFTFLFYEKRKWVYGVVALLFINYLCYCGESCFVLPISMGVCALIFQRKTLSLQEKIFNWLLVGSALLFLSLYAIIVLPNVESVYDGAHGTSVGLLENAIKMILAQKLLVLALIVLVIRIIDVVRNKKVYCFYDNLLLTAAACCLGNFILRLNWTLYYNVAAVLTIPSILYFSIFYLKEKRTVVLFVLLALFYGSKIPLTIQKNQKHRKEVNREVEKLSQKIEDGVDVFWYEPIMDENSFEMVLRDWRYASLNTYLGWIRHDSVFSLKRVARFNGANNTIWLSSVENKELLQYDSCLLEYGELVFHADSIYGYHITFQ